jgi:hypothetical protein
VQPLLSQNTIISFDKAELSKQLESQFQKKVKLKISFEFCMYHEQIIGMLALSDLWMVTHTINMSWKQ